jgi:hypothetical protein
LPLTLLPSFPLSLFSYTLLFFSPQLNKKVDNGINRKTGGFKSKVKDKLLELGYTNKINKKELGKWFLIRKTIETFQAPNS